MAELTPMMRQYFEIKEKHTDCILFFRLGDFYEMFGSDAHTASKELDLTLTTRDRAKENPEERIPMCGIPYHSAEAYIARLVQKGYKIAICEQTEDPATAKGLVDRDVIRIITPGTVIDSSMLNETHSNYIAAVYISDSGAGVCFADISTGEICATAFAADSEEHIINELGRFSPAEVVLCENSGKNDKITDFLANRIECLTQTAPERFTQNACEKRICAQFSVSRVSDISADITPPAICAVGALLGYIADTQKTDMAHINTLDYYLAGRYMELDIQTSRNLELTKALRTLEKKGSLLWVLDKTCTPMGGRLLRSWVQRPLLSAGEIKKRQSAVRELVDSPVLLGEMRLVMREIGDIERLIGKIVYGTANCRDLSALESSAVKLPEVSNLLQNASSTLLSEISSLDTLGDIAALIGRAIIEEPPFSVREGGFIKTGYSEEVDRLRALLEDSTGAMAEIEQKERERTGKKLKVGYNRVFGYYIEIPRSSSEDVPADYVRKQTLANCERFITDELKQLETTLLTAKDRLSELEFSLFTEIREHIAAAVTRVQNASVSVAVADAVCSLAHVAVKNNYTMPEIELSGVLEIRDGRHPVVEVMQTDSLFVPNDVFLDGSECSTAIITGPNMAGKSTYMRQTALIVLMAQIGSFVPAKMARIGIVDRIFTRIGASDDLSAGKSTFMVEMTEVAEILHSATKSSLLILDEIGRGTSTYDGMSIARAVLEHCADRRRLGAKTLFATHYHELTVLEGELEGVKNFNISAKKRGGELIFLRKIVPGGADDSYGIEVAGLAGVPDGVIKRAKQILKELELGAPATRTVISRETDDQISMTDVSDGEIARIIRETDLNTLSPIEAMNLLFELKKKA